MLGRSDALTLVFSGARTLGCSGAQITAPSDTRTLGRSGMLGQSDARTLGFSYAQYLQCYTDPQLDLAPYDHLRAWP